jgi:hypothetical protein
MWILRKADPYDSEIGVNDLEKMAIYLSIPPADHQD